MRRGMRGALMRDDGGVFMGFGLGADYCSEHEWGIKGLKQDFGVSRTRKGLLGLGTKEVEGFEASVITKTPTNLHYFEGKTRDILAIVSDHAVEAVRKGIDATNKNSRDLGWFGFGELSEKTWGTDDEKPGFMGAWSERDFGIAAYSEKARKHLKELWEAFRNKDVAFLFGGGGLFENPGLCLLVASRVPQRIKDDILAKEKDAAALKAAGEATGIVEKLNAANRGFYACSPKWKRNGSFKDIETKHPVVFWLNPMDQQNNHAGWFSVEDLEQWAEGKGPVPMTKEQKDAKRGRR